jgi:uncharacterized protein
MPSATPDVASSQRPWMWLSPDRLSASLFLPAGQSLGLSRLKWLLQISGVRHGVHSAVLSDCSHVSTEDRTVVVAQITPAPSLTNRAVEWFDITEHSAVTLNQDIGRLSGDPIVESHCVDGVPYFPPQPTIIGHGLKVLSDGRIVASSAGHFHKDARGVCSVYSGEHIPLLAENTIGVDHDRLTAWIDIPAHHFCPAEMLQHALSAVRVVRGIESSGISAAGLAVATARRVVLARGMNCQSGKDGFVHLALDERVHLASDAHGAVDFHELGRIADVAKGALLGRIMPPTQGTDGVDVYGQPVIARHGKALDASLVIGEGTLADSEHPSCIHAAVTGHFHRDRNKRLCVQPRFIVEGHVDFRQGNIDTNLSVLINGDILPGFSVKSAGDIEVRGCIDDARVTAQGQLIVHGGILAGKERVKAHGNLASKYIVERTVKCHDLIIASSVRWSTIFATGNVVAQEIMGGSCTAAGHITAAHVGHKEGLPTRVQAGYDPYFADQVARARNDYAQAQNAFQQAKESYEKAAIAHHHGDTNESQWLHVQREFEHAKEKLHDIEQLLARELILIQRRTHTPTTFTITVSGTAYAGCEIWLGNRAHVVLNKTLANCTFYEKDGHVAW